MARRDIDSSKHLLRIRTTSSPPSGTGKRGTAGSLRLRPLRRSRGTKSGAIGAPTDPASRLDARAALMTS